MIGQEQDTWYNLTRLNIYYKRYKNSIDLELVENIHKKALICISTAVSSIFENESNVPIFARLISYTLFDLQQDNFKDKVH